MQVGLRVSLAVFAALVTSVSIAASQPNVPAWPYPQEPAKGSPTFPPDDGQPRHVPGSTQAYTLKQADGPVAVDWFPGSHPTPPANVINGKPGSYFSCGSCHLLNGAGFPETQGLNGLPVAYMQQQFDDMKNGLRDNAMAIRLHPHMIHFGGRFSEAEEKESLDYFHALPPVKWIRVVEAANVPKTATGANDIAILAVDPSGAKEPIGNRIVEVPESYDRTMLHDPTSGFVAYVPPGSLAKGAALARTGAGGRVTACVTCHGADLRGMGDLNPPIAGRSPSATGRQLYDFKTGARHGKNSALMKAVVEKLTDDDILDVTAYLASLPQ